jgi:phytanoyl-CoA hydroxylase
VAMKTKLSQKQVDQYQRDGFLVYRDFMSDTEIGALIGAIEKAVAAMGEQTVSGMAPTGPKPSADDYYSRVFLQKINLWKISEHVKSIFLGPALGEMVSRLAGVDGMRIWHDQTLQKAPWANPTSWHLDNPYWSFDSQQSISIWIALDDATLQNGCMCYLPGTHLTAHAGRNESIGPHFGALFQAYPQWKGIEPVVAAMKRGDCGFHNGLTAHAAGANMTPRWRRAMTCGYMPDGSTFNGTKNILPTDYFESLKIGDLLNSDVQNPLAWHR